MLNIVVWFHMHATSILKLLKKVFVCTFNKDELPESIESEINI